MWLCRGQGKFSSSVNLDVLDVGLNRASKVFSSSELGCVGCEFSQGKENFILSEVKSDACLRVSFQL